jgi:hypothetical protein
VKTESEIRAKLNELLSLDARDGYPDVETGQITERSTQHWITTKVSVCIMLLWVLGENDDDRWHITAAPGPPIPRRSTHKFFQQQ